MKSIESEITSPDSDSLLFIIGPCVIEDDSVMQPVAETLARLREEHRVPVVFKSSFDKANRTSIDSYRGPGLEDGLKRLERIGQEYQLPLITDIHIPDQAQPVSEVVDILQIPAFLCRQTDLVVEAAKTGTPVNIKKGQFLNPRSMTSLVEKARRFDNDRILVTERGSSFGYERWVVDMRNLVTMRETGAKILYDATHSVQLPGARGNATGGQREFIAPQARAAVAVGIDGVFIETHPDPDEARSDGPNMLPLDKLEPLMKSLLRLHEIGRAHRHNMLIEEGQDV